MRPDSSRHRNPDPVPDSCIDEHSVFEQTISSADTILRAAAPRLAMLIHLAEETRLDLDALLTTLRETAHALRRPVSQAPAPLPEPEPIEEPQEIQPLQSPPPRASRPPSSPATTRHSSPPAAARPATPPPPARPSAAPEARPRTTPPAPRPPAAPAPVAAAPKSAWLQVPPTAEEPAKAHSETNVEAIMESHEQKALPPQPAESAAPSSAPTTIRFVCRECGGRLTESTKFVGKQVLCKCGAKNEVPSESAKD